MRNIVGTYVDRFLHERRTRTRAASVLGMLALVVAVGVFWQLHSTGIAMTNEVYCGLEEHEHTDACYELVLTCGYDEDGYPIDDASDEDETEPVGHVHTDACYETVTETTLVCTQEVSDGHEHDESCYNEEGELICGMGEGEGAHKHDESCYVTTNTEVQICGMVEGEVEETETADEPVHVHTDECYEKVVTCGKEEHVHTVECLIDETADLEDASDWEATLPDLTGTWSTDVVAVAESQLGYTESESNFTLADDGKTRQNYSRYGQWYGNPYGDWNVMFASFCYYYADVPEEDFPEASGAYAWAADLKELGLFAYADDDTYTPAPGDLLFLITDEESTRPDTVAIITAVSGSRLTVVQGDCDGEVMEMTYRTGDEEIYGYGILPEQEVEKAEVETFTQTYEGDDYIVTVTYTDRAEIPDEAELQVTEFAKGTDEYLEVYAQIVELYGLETTITVEQAPAEEDKSGETMVTDAETGEIEITYYDYIRAFDIGFYVDGQEIEPAAAVSVVITYLDQEEESDSYTIVHFAEDGTETIETETAYENGEQSIAFDMSSFSTVAVYSSKAGGGGGPGGGGGTGGGGTPGGSDDQELDPSKYTSSSYVFYDTFSATYDSEGNVESGQVNADARDYIDSVVLNNTGVEQQNSTNTSWSTTDAYTLVTYFPNASAGSSSSDYSKEQTVTLTITPKAGYYVTAVVVACTGPSDDIETPYKCNTWSAGNAFQDTFSLSASGAVEIEVTSTDFSHASQSPYYFILIEVAPIPSPLYVEYDYGNIVTLIGDSSADTAFSTANGWVTASGSNNYGSGYNSADVDGEPGVKTANTQFKYAYEGDENAEEAAKWTHTANTITDDAKAQAAAAGYVFAGWKAEYFTTVTVTSQTADKDGYQDAYNNWDYDWKDSYGEATYDEGDTVKLTTNVRLIAQWIPIGVKVEKEVKGLSDTSLSNVYTLYVQTTEDDGETWSTCETVTLTVTGNGSESEIISPLPTGTYRVVEAEESQKDLSGTDSSGSSYYYYISVDDGGQVTVSSSLTEGTDYTETTDGDGNAVALLTGSLTVTNTYSETATTVNITLKKVDATTKDVLSGAGFTINGATYTTDEYGLATVEGLNIGTEYTLTETTAPDGYNKLTSSIVFTITSDKSVTFSSGSGTAEVSTDDGGNIVLTIENTSGTVLPNTGGPGTTPILLLGAALTITSAALLLRRRRRACR